MHVIKLGINIVNVRVVPFRKWSILWQRTDFETKCR